MKKHVLKKVLILAGLSAVATLSIVFAACAEEHAHVYSADWTGNDYYHWHAATCGHPDEVSAKGEHNWDDGKITVAATHETAGIKTYTCKECGKIKEEETQITTEHVYSADWTGNDYYHWHAATCGHPDEVSAKGEHNWDDGRITLEATYETAGIMTFTCKECAKTTTGEIPFIEYEYAGDFTYSESADGTYSVTGLSNESKARLVIPATYRGKAVTTVSDYAFYGNGFHSIILPESIISIGSHAFEGCLNLNELYIGDEKENIITVNGQAHLTGGVQTGEYAFANTGFMALVISDSCDNDTKVEITVSNKYNGIGKLNVSAALNKTTDIVFNDTVLFDRNAKELKTTVDFGTFGLFNDIVITALDYSGNVIATLNTEGVGVTADHYNLALLNASYPVLVYSLKLNETVESGPTFVALERCDAYDWNSLPEGVQCMPFATRYDATANKGFHHLRAGIANYVSELYSLNHNSTFTFFAVDNYPELILQMLVANQIPESQWNAVLLSDGAGTTGILSSTFGIDNPSAKYNEMVENWDSLKSYVYNNGYSTGAVSSRIKYLYGSEYSMLARYPYVITKVQPNVEWWVNRIRVAENISAINAKDSAFATDITKTVKEFNTNSLLSALNEEQQATFKALYHFSGDMFSVAEEQNKEVVVILGTSWSGENGTLYGYIKTLVDMYGTDDYVYYYKGHPGYPTSQYTGRQQYFTQLKEDGYTIYELDNAIAAEIILFFNPGIYMAGYSTSTFDSVESQEKALVLFGKKSNFNNATYKNYFDIFVSVFKDASSYQGVTLESEHEYYLIEYNDTEEYANQTENYSKHEIAVYDATSKVTKYYKLNDTVYAEVGADGQAV